MYFSILSYEKEEEMTTWSELVVPTSLFVPISNGDDDKFNSLKEDFDNILNNQNENKINREEFLLWLFFLCAKSIDENFPEYFIFETKEQISEEQSIILNEWINENINKITTWGSFSIIIDELKLPNLINSQISNYASGRAGSWCYDNDGNVVSLRDVLKNIN